MIIVVVIIVPCGIYKIHRKNVWTKIAKKKKKKKVK